MHIVVLTPVLDDWVSAREVLSRLDTVFASRSDTVSLLIVDDGSSQVLPPDFGQGPYTQLQSIDILRLKKNLGHQRALAVGLCHITEKIPCDAVLVMDCDGEDDPRDAARLAARLEELRAGHTSALPIIFAERTRRSESLVFRFGYFGYRALHYLLTGRGIRIGNFSIIPHARLAALVTEPMLWNHYAASVAGSKLPRTTIPSHRGTRIDGKSRHNFVGLVIHGLSALSCYNEIIGVRLILMTSFLCGLSLLVLAITVILRLLTDLPIPGWTSLFAGILIVFLLQLITLAVNFTMQIINARTVQSFLPLRDYVWFVDSVRPCYRRSIGRLTS